MGTSNMLNYEEYIEKEKELDLKMSKIWDNPRLDGITDFEKYIKAPVKILWILKEPNEKKGGNHRNFHKDVRDYGLWTRTYANIMRVVYGILNEVYDYDNIPKIDTSECTIDDQILLDEIAIININKSGGGSSTNQRRLEQGYEQDNKREFLKKQIEFINPEIIINSHRINKFISDQIGENNIVKIHGERFGFNNSRLIIDTSHPNTIGYSNKNYCNNILSIIANNY
jgi:hypothetical protein